jgi:hypothetical protein
LVARLMLLEPEEGSVYGIMAFESGPWQYGM